MGFFSRLSTVGCNALITGCPLCDHHGLHCILPKGRLAAKQRFKNESYFRDPSKINVVEVAGAFGLSAVLLYDIFRRRAEHHRVFTENYDCSRHYCDPDQRLLYGIAPDVSFLMKNAVGVKDTADFHEQMGVRTEEEMEEELLFYSDNLSDNKEYIQRHCK